jgi:hypothetical protein
MQQEASTGVAWSVKLGHGAFMISSSSQKRYEKEENYKSCKAKPQTRECVAFWPGEGEAECSKN